MRSLNLAVRFLIELVAFGSVAVYGWHAGGPVVVKVLLAVALLAVAVALWGMFVAPRARWYLPLGGRLAVEAVVLGGGAVALAGLGHPVLGAGFAALAVVNRVLIHVWRQDDGMRGAAPR